MLIENRVRQPQHENPPLSQPKNDHGMWDEDLGAPRPVLFIAPLSNYFDTNYYF